MKIVIYGANELAGLIAANLFEDHDIIVIDDNGDNSESFEKLDIEYVQGSGANINVLESVGIKNADIFIACTENDEANARSDGWQAWKRRFRRYAIPFLTNIVLNLIQIN